MSRSRLARSDISEAPLSPLVACCAHQVQRCAGKTRPPRCYPACVGCCVCHLAVTNGLHDCGEQGRRVSASRTTVLRDGAHVWRSRRAGHDLIVALG
jgi:hypothetical protein